MQTSFVPLERSKNWKEEIFVFLDRIVSARIEGTEAEPQGVQQGVVHLPPGNHMEACPR